LIDLITKLHKIDKHKINSQYIYIKIVQQWVDSRTS